MLRSRTVGALFALAVAEVVATVAAGVVSGVGTGALLHGFAVSNAILGLSLAVAGWPIARHRPDNPIGWLLLAAGICYTTSAAGYAVLAAATAPGEHAPGWRLLGTVTNVAWTWAISLLLPVALLLFPDGRLLGRRWRWVVWLAVAGSVQLAVMAVIPPDTLSAQLGVQAYLTVPNLPRAGWVAVVMSVVGTTTYVAATVSLVVRYRRGDERVRRQLLWLLLGLLAVLVVSISSDLLYPDSWASIFAYVLLPLSVLVAILRHQLLDIRLVVSRSVLYVLLTGAIVGAYVGLVALLDAALRRQIGLGSSIVATLVIALAFNPVRIRLQRLVDRLFFGARNDPVRAIAEIGARLGDGPTGLAGVLDVLCRVLRFPSAAITVAGREIASAGTPPALRQSVPLRQGNEPVGELTVGLRSGEARLAPADERVLVLLSASLAVAVRATLLADDLADTREALVTAREEERRRLRRDLHDGLGPALTGVVLKADAARRLAGDPTGRVAMLLADLRAETTAAVDDIRRLVNELRPPALDGLGLIGALRETASKLSGGTPLRVRVAAPEPFPRLSAAAEVAVYRIATEALTNVSRHARATAATIGLRADTGCLTLTVRDNGTDCNGVWQPGVGLTSMRERAVELGGECEAGPGPDGGRVTVTIPLRSTG